jgi:hypothetical protein
MPNFRIAEVPLWCLALIEIIRCEWKMHKYGTWFVLWFAPAAKIYTLGKFFLAIQQNIEYFIRKLRTFSTVYKLLWSKSSGDTVAWLGICFVT